MTDALDANEPNPTYRDDILQSDVDALAGPVLLNFGTNWCGHCQAAAPAISKALKDFPPVKHIAVEDGPRRKFGRSSNHFWPEWRNGRRAGLKMPCTVSLYLSELHQVT
jgi:thiol-disulfide isomerase/thioredoxin